MCAHQGLSCRPWERAAGISGHPRERTSIHALCKNAKWMHVLDEKVEDDGAFVAARDRLVTGTERQCALLRELVVQNAPVVLKPTEMAAEKKELKKRQIPISQSKLFKRNGARKRRRVTFPRSDYFSFFLVFKFRAAFRAQSINPRQKESVTKNDCRNRALLAVGQKGRRHFH